MPQYGSFNAGADPMSLSRILGKDDAQGSAPRGIKRSRDGSPRYFQAGDSSFASSSTLHQADQPTYPHSNYPPLNPLPSLTSPFPAHVTTENPEMSSTYYDSSPFNALFDATEEEDFEALLDRVDGLSPQHSRRSSYPRGPDLDAFPWGPLGRTSPLTPRRDTSRLHRMHRGRPLSRQEDHMGNRQSRQEPETINSDSDSSSSTSTPFGSLFDDSEEGPDAPRRLAEIDLTQESDTMTPPHPSGSKRKRGHHDDDPDDGAPGPSNPRTAKRSQTTANGANVESISLLDDDDNPTATSILSKQRADAVASQNIPSPSSHTTHEEKPQRQPTKLTGMQCTICMDSPHELTATTCGHVFCRECISGWVGAPDVRGRAKNCPACRTALTVVETGKRRGNKHTLVALEFMRRTRPVEGA